MGNSSSTAVSRLLGIDGLEGSNLAVRDGDYVHYRVTDEMQDNYLTYCHRLETAINPMETINQYTNHVTEHYAKVNLSLAADAKGLSRFTEYIPQLRASILNKPLLDNGRVYRGVEISDLELEHMEMLGKFYIPSFTSTSIDMKRAYDKSSLMVFDIPYASPYACSITENLSPFFQEEREVLLSCYSAFRLQRVEMDNGKKIISLYLDDHLSGLNSLR